MVQLGLKDSSRNCTQGYRMDFASYLHLIFLIIGQTFEVIVAIKKILGSKRPHTVKSRSVRLFFIYARSVRLY